MLKHIYLTFYLIIYCIVLCCMEHLHNHRFVLFFNPYPFFTSLSTVSLSPLVRDS